MHYLIKEWKTTGKTKKHLPLKTAFSFFLDFMSLLIYIYASIYVTTISFLPHE